jgi:hypothetical protein
VSGHPTRLSGHLPMRVRIPRPDKPKRRVR